MIAFYAYAADCRLQAELDPGPGRLTDLLNASDRLQVANARLESLADGHLLRNDTFTVELDELLAVVATGYRGDPSRRIRTRTIEVVARLGPYQVTGSIHGTPASNPLVGIMRRPPWIPLTRARIAYRRSAQQVIDEVPILIVNRAGATSLHAVDEDAERLPLDSLGVLPQPVRDPLDPSDPPEPEERLETEDRLESEDRLEPG